MLGVTIFYALRLSKSLNNFKAHRQDFQDLMQELTRNIEQAYTSIETLKQAGTQSGEELKETVAEAKYLLDELQLVNASSENLAQRLEKSAEDNRSASYREPEHYDEADEEEGTQPWEHMLEKHDKEDIDDDDGFMIRDPDLNTGSIADLGKKRSQAQGSGNDSSLQSQAERELFEALNQTKKRKS